MCDVLRECDFGIIDDFGAKEINARYFADRSDRLRVGSAGRIVTAVVGTFASPTA
jgi:hypothetical protein